MTPAEPRPGRLPAIVWWLTAAWTLSATADSVLMFVIVWLAGPQGWTGATIALVVLAMRLPSLLGGPLGGFAVDRCGPGPMLLADGVLRSVVVAWLAASVHHGVYPIGVMVIGGAVAGASAPVSYAATRTLISRLVLIERRSRANAVLGIGDQLPLLIGAALAGGGVAALGPAAAFAIPVLLLLAMTTIALLLVRGPIRRTGPPQVEPGPPSTRPRRWPSGVTGLMALSVAYYLAYGPFGTVLPFFVRDHLYGGIGTYTLLWLGFSAAALATLPLAPVLARGRPGLVNAAGAAIWGLCTLPLVATDRVPLAVAVFTLSGAIWGPYSAIEATALQRWTPTGDHGRIFGVNRALLVTASPLGAASGVVALQYVSAPTVLGTSAVCCAIVGCCAMLSPSLRTPHKGTRADAGVEQRGVRGG